MIENTELLKQIADIEVGKTAYLNGTLDEVRYIAQFIGNYIVALGHEPNTCKVSRLPKARNTEPRSFMEQLRTDLERYSGTPLVYDVSRSKLSVSVTRYNATNGTRFKVSTNEEGKLIVFSKDVKDHFYITKSALEAYKEKVLSDLDELESKAIDDDEIPSRQTVVDNDDIDLFGGDDDDDSVTPDPSIFVTRPHYDPLPEIEAPQNWKLANCSNCGEEFTTLNKDQVWCEDCINDDEDIV